MIPDHLHFRFLLMGSLSCWVMTVVHRWSVATCKLGYCPGVLLLFAQLLLVLWFCSANAVWKFFLFGFCWSARDIKWYGVNSG